MSLTADFDPKPMAISSIISSSSTTSSYSSTSPSSYQAASSSSSPPSSPETRQRQVYHHHNHSYSHGGHQHGSSSNGDPYSSTPSPSCTMTGATANQPPLSLQERRQRNKAASAKYRAKKNQQHGEMRTLITSLTKENELLLRQLDHIKRENGRLKTTCDRLRGKKVAAKILKRFLANNNHHGGVAVNSKAAAATTDDDETLDHFDLDEEEDELIDLMDPQQPPQH